MFSLTSSLCDLYRTTSSCVCPHKSRFTLCDKWRYKRKEKLSVFASAQTRLGLRHTPKRAKIRYHWNTHLQILMLFKLFLFHCTLTFLIVCSLTEIKTCTFVTCQTDQINNKWINITFVADQLEAALHWCIGKRIARQWAAHQWRKRKSGARFAKNLMTSLGTTSYSKRLPAVSSRCKRWDRAIRHCFVTVCAKQSAQSSLFRLIAYIKVLVFRFPPLKKSF